RATEVSSGTELYKSDGSDVGTVLIKDIYNNNNSGAAGNSNVTMAALNGYVYFAGTTATSGQEIWRSDGTPGGTTQIAEITSGSSGSGITQITASGNLVYFNVTSSGNTGLWRTDGTSVTRITTSPATQ